MSADPNDDLLVDEVPSDKKVDVIVIPSADDAPEEPDDKLEKEEGDEPEADKKPEPEDDEPLDDELLEDAPAAPALKKLVAKEEPPPLPPKQEAKPQYTVEQWANAYDQRIRAEQAEVEKLKAHMDGDALIQGRTSYDEMKPSQRRAFELELAEAEAKVHSWHAGKSNKIAEVQAAELETQVSQVVVEIARLNPAFKDCDEATRERIEGRYMKALANGSLARMDEGQFLTAMTKGITPVKVPAKGAAPKSAPRRNTQTVRQPDSTFRVKREAPAEAAPKTRGLDANKVHQRYRAVMGYDASPTAELEDLVETIRLNSKKGA